MDYLSQKPSDNTTRLPSGQQENENEQNKNQQISDINIELILSRKRTRSTNRIPIIGRSNDDNLFENSDANVSGISSNNDIALDDEDLANKFEDYSYPSFTLFQETATNNDQFSWILIWIMSFCIRFNLSETATESLIKFMKLVLKEIGGNGFDSFPNLLYLMKKSLVGLQDNFCHFVCHVQIVTNYIEKMT